MSEDLNIIFSTMFQVFQKKTDSAHQISHICHIDYMHVSWEMVSDRDGPGHSFVMFVILFGKGKVTHFPSFGQAEAGVKDEAPPDQLAQIGFHQGHQLPTA